jgi:hypothetical protein
VPTLHGGRRRRAVEGRVNFQGIETFGVIGEMVTDVETVRIKWANPVFIAEAHCAQVPFCQRFTSMGKRDTKSAEEAQRAQRIFVGG